MFAVDGLRTLGFLEAGLLATLVLVVFAAEVIPLEGLLFLAAVFEERVAELPPLDVGLAATREELPLEVLLAADFLAPRDVVLRAALDLEAAFLAGRLDVFLATLFLAVVFLAAVLFTAFLAVLLFAVLFLAVVFFAAPLAADFLAVVFFAADFFAGFLVVDLEAALLEPVLEVLDAVLEPPRPVVRPLEAALLRPVDLAAVLDLVLPPALLEEVFLEAAFLVDFAIVNGF